MKAIRLHVRGGLESFVFEDAPTPEPGEGEVLVRVHAAAVTPTELKWTPTWTTTTGEPRSFPIILGHEFSGEIAALGSGVAGMREGEAVFGMNDWFRDGAQAEYCVARVTDITAKPPSVDHLHAAITTISALTAWQGLYDLAQLAEGERILVHGGAGAVGTCAIQLACRRGAYVFATASAHNLEFVHNLGAAEVIDYRTTQFEEVIRDIDVVFDCVGGETLDRSWSVLKSTGRLVTIAASSEQTKSSRVRDAFFIVKPNATQLHEIAGLLGSGALRVIIGDIFPLAQARLAYIQKPYRGKVVLSIVTE